MPFFHLAYLGRCVLFLRTLIKWRWTMVTLSVLYVINNFCPFGEDDRIVTIPRDYLQMQQKKEQMTTKKILSFLSKNPDPPNLLSRRVISSDSLSLQGWWMSHVKWDVTDMKRRSSSKTRQVFSVACSLHRIIETYQHLRLNTSLPIRGIRFRVSSTASKIVRLKKGRHPEPFYGARVHVVLTCGKARLLKLEFAPEPGKIKSKEVEYVLRKGERIRSVTVMLGCFGYRGFVAFTDLSVKPMLDKNVTYGNLEVKDFLDSCPPPVRRHQSANRSNNTTSEVLYSSFSSKDEDSITMVTQLTLTRIDMLKQNLKFWKGPISIVMYVVCREEDNLNTKKELVRRLLPPRMFRKFSTASVVILYGNEIRARYPINRLRNIAIKHSKTQYLFLVDADFVPSPDLHSIARDRILEYTQENGENIQTAFVVPAFEELKELGAHLDSDELPETKEELVKVIKKGDKLSSFMESPLSHSSTDYHRWYNSEAPYEIQKYQDKYEPYLILRRSPKLPLYDDRFTGYGMNKISHIIELSLLRYKFVVLPDVWIIHRYHKISPLSWFHRTDPERRFANRIQRFEFISDVYSKHKLAECSQR